MLPSYAAPGPARSAARSPPAFACLQTYPRELLRLDVDLLRAKAQQSGQIIVHNDLFQCVSEFQANELAHHSGFVLLAHSCANALSRTHRASDLDVEFLPLQVERAEDLLS